jgi:tRNA(Arg) A34 adenosine deaminase TadA
MADPTQPSGLSVGDADDTSSGNAWQQALRLAWDAFRAGTTPVGAVVVSPAGVVVAAGRGRRYERSGPAGQLANSHVAHAEVNALAQLGADRHWEDHQLLTTLEPCGMCHGAAVQATVGTIIFAAPDPYAGTSTLRFDTPQSRRRRFIVSGPLSDARGAFATLLHLVWLIERGGVDHHTVAAHQAAMPAFTEYARSVHRDLVATAAADDYTAAVALGKNAPPVVGMQTSGPVRQVPR